MKLNMDEKVQEYTAVEGKHKRGKWVVNRKSYMILQEDLRRQTRIIADL